MIAKSLKLAFHKAGMATFPVTLIKTQNKEGKEKERKAPAWKGWQNLPASDPPTRNPNYGIALSNKYLVIDVDVKNGKKGRESWERMLALLTRPLSNAIFTEESPSGGWHVWFNLPEGFKVIKNNHEYPDIDFLSKGAYVVGPGTHFKDSVYPNPYKIIQGTFDPEEDFHLDISVPPLPEEWYPIVGNAERRTSQYREKQEPDFDFWDAPHVIQEYIFHLEHCPPAIEGRNGHDTAYREAACKGRDYGLYEETTLRLILKHYNPRCDPPWQEGELEEIVANAYQYATGQIGKENYANYLDELEEETLSELAMKPPDKTTGNLSGLIPHKRASDIQAKPVDWLWKERIARGKLTMLAGDPGLGKSQITANFAATVSTGGAWPDQTTMSGPGTVVFLSAEDEPEDTIVPRLKAAGADLDRVVFLANMIPKQGSVNLREHIRGLESTLAQFDNLALLVIDPITAYLGGVDSHKNADVRALLTPLSDMASKLKIAILCVSHLSKSKGNGALMSVMGSLAFVAAVRAAFFVAKHPTTENLRVFLPLKNNIGTDRGGFAYMIESATIDCEEEDLEAPRIVWSSEPIAMSANEVLASSTGGSGKVSALADAKAVLEELLADGARPSLEVQEAAKEYGIVPATLRRARVELGIKTHRAGYQGAVLWALPNDYSAYLPNEPILAQEDV
jgi:hypothetical protein